MRKQQEYIFWDKEELVNLSHSLNAEILSTNHGGGYMSSSVVLCNTRKYHGAAPRTVWRRALRASF